MGIHVEIWEGILFWIRAQTIKINITVFFLCGDALSNPKRLKYDVGILPSFWVDGILAVCYWAASKVFVSISYSRKTMRSPPNK